MRNINLRYVEESYDEQGMLKTYKLNCPADFNFAYDIVDDIATHDPTRRALVWANPEGEEHVFTFADMKYWSDKTAHFFQELGLGKGDFVMVILRRHYQFWFTALALNKLGCVMVPATFMLKTHDLEYRLNEASIKAIVATSVGDIADVVDAALAAGTCPTVKTLILVNGAGGGTLVDASSGGAGGSAGADAGGAGSAGADAGGAGSAGADAGGAGAGVLGVADARAIADAAVGAGAASPALYGEALSGEAGICAAPAPERAGWVDFNVGVAASSPDFTRIATATSDPLLMYFSSGTSGNPKMVLHNSSYALAHILTAKHWHNVNPDGIHFTIADTGWGKAVWGKYFGQWIMEACVFAYDFDRFHPSEILSLIARYHITTLCCPPTMYRLMMGEDFSAYDLSSLEYSTTAGEALNPDIFAFWKKHTGLSIYEGFGQTETPLIIGNLTHTTPKGGSMGKPVPLFNTRILRADGTECETGETGEICIDMSGAHPGIMVEYYRNADKTAAALHDGWYHTGDTAWCDEDGYFWYVGRNDDVIKSSGYRIGPFELESVLLEHAAVADCAVTGVPDPVRGKAVKATIVLAAGFNGSDDLTYELQQWVKERTAPYKYPRIIEYVEELPRTVNGKIRRVAIRANDEGVAAARAGQRETGLRAGQEAAGLSDARGETAQQP